MRILFLSPRQVLPARSGAKLREFHFLRALGRSAEISYLYFIDPGAAPLTTADLPFCRDVTGIPKPPAYGAFKTAQGILGRLPLPVLNYTSPAMETTVAKAWATRDFDFVHLDSIHMIGYARHPAIYNWHNIESEAMLRYSETAKSPARRWYARHTARKLEILEKRILKEAFGHIVCSQRERDRLLNIVPEARIAVVENGVDVRFFETTEPAPLAPGIVFVGAMDYFPNADAAISFATRTWPAVREKLTEKLGGAQLSIVGANPGPAVLALGNLPGVTVTGMVPDVRPFYRGALAAVVPLRTGGGTRLKILEAMAAGVPVVSTPLGAEGLDARDGKNILLAEPGDIAGWTDKIAGLSDSALREQLTGAALQLVKTHYDWEILGEKLRMIYSEWLPALTPPPAR